MKQKLRIRNLSTIFLFFGFIFLSCFETVGQLPDKNMASKYGLTIPQSKDQLDPAPEWLQKSDMVTMSGWYITSGNPNAQNPIWKGYDLEFKDVTVERIIRLASSNGSKKVHEMVPVVKDGTFDGTSIKGVSLISHAPVSQAAFTQAHEQGFRVIPYVHFTDIHDYYADQDVFIFEHPEILLKDANGKWMHIPMDGSDRLYRFLTCANSPRYWNLALIYVKKIMDWGADGIFIDNVGNRQTCFAQNFIKTSPEFPPYVHEHLFPSATQDEAWDLLLQSIRSLVKGYGEDKIVLLNSGIGTQFEKDGDCCMWESFIYSWAWEGRLHTWQDVKKKAQDNAWYLDAGRRITALSYLNTSRTEVKDDAFWAFSAARLVDFIWWSSLKGTDAEVLYQAHMGSGLESFKETNGLAYRAFENGLIVLNDNTEDQNVELTLPDGFQPDRLLDLFNDSQIIQVINKKVTVAVPKKTARVYLKPSDSFVKTVHDLVIPTLITPNMDGRNDYFVLKGIENLGKAELIIFDRKGAEVYKNMNYRNSWNGLDNKQNPLPADTYFFVLKTELGKSTSGYVVISNSIK
jgi:gliding motility-associated-like protein